jgi:hypothetical protein
MPTRKPSTSQGTRKKKGGGKRPGAKSLPPKDSQAITLAEAKAYTARYRRLAPASEKGGFFYSAGIEAILAQPGCVGLRYYHGVDENGYYRIVLVGVDGNGNDILTTSSATKKRAAALAAGDAVILDRHWQCPPWCPPDIAL